MSEFGHFLCNGVVIPHKYHLFQWKHATFSFHDDLKDTHLEPERSLHRMYRDRAHELRARHSHLALMYSGGNDSDQVLKTYLKHAIPLDEIITCWPFRFMKTLPADHKFLMLHEYEYNVVQGLRKARDRFPRIKITEVDTTDLYTMFDENDLEIACRHGRMHGGLYNVIQRIGEARELERRDKPMGVIYGSEKPYVTYKRGKFYIYFTDLGRSGADLLALVDRPLFEPHMFFWGDPYIAVKQAHIVMHAINSDPEKKRKLLEYAAKFSEVTLDFKEGIVDLSVIYPDWRNPVLFPKMQNEYIGAAINPRLPEFAAQKAKIIRLNYNVDADLTSSSQPIEFRTPYHFIGDLL